MSLPEHTRVGAFALVLLGGLAVASTVRPQDAECFDVAGHMWSAGDRGVYQVVGDDVRVSDRFLELTCPAGDAACLATVAPFVSPPIALPLSAALAATGHAGAIVRLASAGILLWAFRRLGAPTGGILLGLPAVALLAKGQNAALLLVALLGSPWVAGVALALGIALKASPAALLPVLVAARRWRELAAAGAVLLLLEVALLVHPVAGAGWLDWLHFTRAFAATAGAEPANIGAWSAPFAPLVVLLVAWAAFRRPFAQAWRVAWAAWPLLSPLSWWYYGWVSVAAVAAGPLERRRAALLFGLVFVVAGVGPGGPPWLGALWFALGFAAVLSEASAASTGRCREHRGSAVAASPVTERAADRATVPRYLPPGQCAAPTPYENSKPAYARSPAAATSVSE